MSFKKIMSFLLVVIVHLSYLLPAGLHRAMGQPEGVYRISFDRISAEFHYGTYSELTLQLVGSQVINTPVSWSISEGELPPGLDLETSETSTVRVFGTPRFSDRWCFALTARTESVILASKEICTLGLDDTAMVHPHFRVKSLLTEGQVGANYRERLKYEPSAGDSFVAGDILAASMPDGVALEFQGSLKRFLVSGVPRQEGTHRFALRLRDSQNNEISQQFQLEINPQQREPNYQCPPGYYYDENYGHCIDGRDQSCPAGTYYDPNTSTCEAYRRVDYCSAGYYYDHFLNRCVYEGYPRCPYNYEYDAYYGRCVRERHSCPVGYEYDWNLRECRRSPYDNCPVGSHFDYTYNRCVRDREGCPRGTIWDPATDRCEPNRRVPPPPPPHREPPPPPPHREPPPPPPPHREPPPPPPHREPPGGGPYDPGHGRGPR